MQSSLNLTYWAALQREGSREILLLFIATKWEDVGENRAKLISEVYNGKMRGRRDRLGQGKLQLGKKQNQTNQPKDQQTNKIKQNQTTPPKTNNKNTNQKKPQTNQHQTQNYH